MNTAIDDIRVHALKSLIPPTILIEELPSNDLINHLVKQTRQQAQQIMQGLDNRLLVIVGPCSIHDPNAALDYAKRLLPVAKRLSNQLLIIMRVYFEKPRTSLGWKGLINDPHLDGSFSINEGLRIARKLLRDINQLGLPTATEFLDTMTPQFIADLISWSAIGARTTESQIHRDLASGLSMPVGFKNGTTGNVQIAIDAIRSANHPQHFLGLTKQGMPAIISTKGNDCCHIILRGSYKEPNYSEAHIQRVTNLAQYYNLCPGLMVDCSHGNSQKDYTQQAIVAQSLCQQINKGNNFLRGAMLESNLISGKQVLTTKDRLTYGQSITDACVNLEETIVILEKLANSVSQKTALLQQHLN